MKVSILENTPLEAMLALAKFVKTVRLDKEMTLDDLALKVGVSRSTLTRLEHGGSGSIETQMKVLAALGVLDPLVSSFVVPEKQLTIAELKKMSMVRQRQRGKRKTNAVS